MERTSLTLQPTEQALLAAATRLYAAYVVSGQVAEGQEDGWRARAIRESVWMAQQIEESIHSDSEKRA
jgi:hypothetical protein